MTRLFIETVYDTCVNYMSYRTVYGGLYAVKSRILIFSLNIAFAHR